MYFIDPIQKGSTYEIRQLQEQTVFSCAGRFACVLCHSKFHQLQENGLDFVFATDMTIHCGFPFSFYYFSGWGAGYIWSGIIADVIVAAIASFVVGIIWPFIKQRKPDTA